MDWAHAAKMQGIRMTKHKIDSKNPSDCHPVDVIPADREVSLFPRSRRDECGSFAYIIMFVSEGATASSLISLTKKETLVANPQLE